MDPKRKRQPAKPTADKKADTFWATIEERTATISAKLNRKVYPIVIVSKDLDGSFVTGFAYVPDLITQLRLIDKSAGNDNGFSLEACSQALDSLLIVSETDPRISDKTDFDYWKGACMTLAQFMGVAVPVLKKK